MQVFVSAFLPLAMSVLSFPIIGPHALISMQTFLNQVHQIVVLQFFQKAQLKRVSKS